MLCAPVLEMPNGTVRYLLIFFAASDFLYAEPGQAMDLMKRESKRQTKVSLSFHTSRAAPTEPFTFPAGQRLAPAIFPRRKPGVEPGVQKAPPVVVTPELLLSLHNMPLNQAAEAIGVSATAFKKACRKLGISRWAYKRGTAKGERERGAARKPAAAAAARPPAATWQGRPMAGALPAQPCPAACMPTEDYADTKPAQPPSDYAVAAGAGHDGGCAAAPAGPGGWRSVFADCAALDADDSSDPETLLGWASAAVSVSSDPGSPLVDAESWLDSPPPPPPAAADDDDDDDDDGAVEEADAILPDVFLLCEPLGA